MKNFSLWLIAVIITLSSAYYQRMTGPTHPMRGKANLGDTEIKYKLKRSHGGDEDHEVSIAVENSEITGELFYKRYKTDDAWETIPMLQKENSLVAKLPHQPPAGKLQYKVTLKYQAEQITIPDESFVIIRFKGAVPALVLIPHIILMFAAMLLSNRAGIEALKSDAKPRNYTIYTVIFLLLGGMILGPVVQKFAFGALWTGFPFGHDLTDNKTLIAMIAWIVALIAGRKGKQARWWVLSASIILLLIYLIPHSTLGSELDYSKMDIPQ